MKPIAFLILVLSVEAWSQGVPSSQCFPLEQLSPEQRAKSEQLLLKALDSEALYTIVGGIKPMSGSFVGAQVKVRNPDLTRVNELRELMAPWHCGDELSFGLHHYSRVHGPSAEGPDASPVRTLEAEAFNRPLIAEAIRKHQAFFAPFGITPNVHPVELLMAMEYIENNDRYRGLGYLFGYPDEAVEFFARETQIPQTRNSTNPHEPPVRVASAAEEKRPVTPRKFLQIPTFGSATGRFVYAVAADHVEDATDRSLRERAAPVLAEYRARRAKFIGEGKPGVAAMLRDWFCRSATDCKPSNATFTTPVEAAK